MGKHVTMMAIIGGAECVVGKCHPGQARILIKNGMAEWRDGKVFFLQSLPKKVEGWTPAGEWDPGSFERKIERSPDWDWARFTEIHAILSGQEIPSSSVVEATKTDRVVLGEIPTRPTEIKCDSFLEWHQIAEERKAAGHTLLSCDDPYQRMIGFVDDTTNEWFGIGLMKFKEGPPELKEALASRDGRISFFSSGLDEFIQGFFSEESTEGESENQPENLDLTLESIWMADAEAEIEAHEAEALNFVLLSDGTLAESIAAAETEVAPDFYRARDVADAFENPEIPKTPRQKFEDGKLYSDDAYRSMLDEVLEREALVHIRKDDGNWFCGSSVSFGEGTLDLPLVTCRRCKNKAIDLIEKAEREK